MTLPFHQPKYSNSAACSNALDDEFRRRTMQGHQNQLGQEQDAAAEPSSAVYSSLTGATFPQGIGGDRSFGSFFTFRPLLPWHHFSLSTPSSSWPSMATLTAEERRQELVDILDQVLLDMTKTQDDDDDDGHEGFFLMDFGIRDRRWSRETSFHQRSDDKEDHADHEPASNISPPH